MTSANSLTGLNHKLDRPSPVRRPPEAPLPRQRARPATFMVVLSGAATKRRTAQPGWGQTTPLWE